jgi:hypothetical protein
MAQPVMRADAGSLFLVAALITLALAALVRVALLALAALACALLSLPTGAPASPDCA